MEGVSSIEVDPEISILSAKFSRPWIPTEEYL